MKISSKILNVQRKLVNRFENRVGEPTAYASISKALQQKCRVKFEEDFEDYRKEKIDGKTGRIVEVSITGCYKIKFDDPAISDEWMERPDLENINEDQQ